MANRELNDEQKQFIEDTLKSHEDLEMAVSEDNSDKDKVKIVKVKKERVPGYKNPLHWLVAVTSLPILLIIGFFALLMRAEQYLGGKETLDYLVEHNKGEEGKMIREVAVQAGQGWLPGFLSVYEYRTAIVAVLIALFLIIIIMFVLIDNKIHAKKDSAVDDNEKNENLDYSEDHKENTEEYSETDNNEN